MASSPTPSPRSLVLQEAAQWIFIGLLIYMPFHVLLSTWVGSSLGMMTAAKILKDIVLFGGFLAALLAADGKTLLRLISNKLVWLIAAYGTLTVLLAVIRPTEQDAEVLGVVYNLRFLLFMIYGGLVISWQGSKAFLQKTVKLAILAGLAVAAFGILQYAVLPDDALGSLGYSKANGTPAAFFIDDKPDLERAMSTLKDPNSLGAYMIIIIALLLGLIASSNKNDKRKYIGGVLLAAACLLLSFSRGALLGMAVAAAVFLMLEPRVGQLLKKRKKTFVALPVALLLIATGVFAVARDTYFVKNVVFHADEATVLEDPNELRLRFLRESIADITDNPVGSGPGTAGLASIRNQEQGTILNENYFLQIATEAGLLGFLLFAAILGAVSVKLYALKENWAARGLLAGLAGLLLTSLLIHTWSNEAIAYTWWGLAGLLISGVLIKGKTAAKTDILKQ